MNSYFITAVYMLYNFKNGKCTLTLANGGHPKPLIYRRSTDEIIQISASGTVIGSFDTASYKQESVELYSGDRIYLFTDGIPESENAKKQMIGFEKGIIDLFRKSFKNDLDETLDRVLEEVKNYTGGKPYEDDIVLMGFEIK
jgi:sigma-B regulation protein RsbU (phosphoserine phosphatase)